MPKRKTTREYIEECRQKGYDLPIDEYVNARTKIKHICSKCGYVYEQNPTHHLEGHGCPRCAVKTISKKLKGVNKKTTQEYVKDCKQLGIDLPIESYVNTKVKIKHKCNKCGNIYLQTPDSHLRGRGCPKCGIKNITKTHETYVQECKKLGYDLPIERYKGTGKCIKHKCSRGHIYIQRPNNHLQGQGCPICKQSRKTTQSYIEDCKRLGYDLPIEEYVNVNTNIKHKCKQGHTYSQRPSHHLYGIGCPICSQSHGEKFIQNYLDKHNIPYEPQKKFKDLKDKTYLSYDFYLSKQNILIEYQGKQHFIAMDFFGGTKCFKVQQNHDKVKKEYAKNSGYTLLEPTYKLDTQDKINDYLDKHL